MRLILILACLSAMAAIGWFAMARGLDRPGFRGAAQIEAETAAAVRQALGDDGAGLRVVVSGRDVSLAGRVDSAEQRAHAIAAARSVPLARNLDDGIEVLPRADPFRLVATKSQGSGMTLEGNVPSREVEQRLVDGAKALSPDSAEPALQLAAGAPQNWEATAMSGIEALAPLSDGRVVIAGTDVTLTGTAPTPDARAAALAAAKDAPGHWTTEITGGEPEPYAFTAMKTPDGAVIIGGKAPDAATLDALTGAADAISSQPVGSTVEIAEGMPSPDWPALAQRGMTALGKMSEGLLTVSDMQVSLAGKLEGAEDLTELQALLGAGWKTDLEVEHPTRAPEVRMELAEDGSLTASGLLPKGLTPEAFAAMLPGADIAGIDRDETGRPADWRNAAEGLTIALPSFETAAVTLSADRLAIEGRLKRGFSEKGTRAALRSALGPDWQLDLQIDETGALPEVLFRESDGAVTLSGLLPTGLEPPDAVALIGARASGDGLAGGGDGSAEDWTKALQALADSFALFDSASGQISPGKVDLSGTLKAGYAPQPVADRLSARLPEGWQATVKATETPPGEGDRRISLATGKAENYRHGHWLPELDFKVSRESCKAEADEALAGEQVRFAGGSAEIDEAGMALIDKLAAIAVRCLNSSTLRLVIEGYTDSVGNDRSNQKLSEERAGAVRQALIERGVRREAVTAAGYGEDRPIATNDTPEGRARNRRIAFEWSEPEAGTHRETASR